MNGLTEDLLTLARGDSNQLLLQKEDVDPKAFIQQLAQPFQEIVEMKDKQFVLEYFPDKPMQVDEKRINQALVILLDNALKYTEAEDKIILQSEISNDNWLIEVKTTVIPSAMKTRSTSLNAFTEKIVPAPKKPAATA